MPTSIGTVTARNKLTPKREPYWHRLRKGCHLGYRKMTADSSGQWIARYRTDEGKQVHHTLGSLDEYPAHDRFDRASILAMEWFKHLDHGGSVEVWTVQNACTAYVTHIKEKKGEKAAADLEARYERWIMNDPIRKVPLLKLKREQIRKFRHHLCNAPVRVNTRSETRVRSKASINRDMTALRAALNHAHAEGKVSSTVAWEQDLKPFEDASVSRTECLDRNQRRQLIKHADADTADLLTGLSLLPLRPGALAALEVRHLDQRQGMLTIGKDKHGQDRKIKLPRETLTLLAAHAKDKLPTAPLLSRANGKPWNKDAWKKPIKRAAVAAGLPANVTAYTLRHSTITDLIVGGLDPLTVAKIAGTSVTMIERYYGHLRQEVAARALAQLVL